MFLKAKKPNSIPPQLILIILVILMVPACIGRKVKTPTETPGPTATPVKSGLPTKNVVVNSPTAPSTAIETSSSRQTGPFFTQDFTDGFTGWKNFFQGNSGSPENSYYSLIGGKLVFSMDTANTGLYLIYQDQSYVDIDISIRTENRSTRSSISLVCGYQESIGWYEFNISSQGVYSLRRFDESGNMTTIKQGGSKSIRVGQDINDYSIICKASQSIALNINGKDIIDYEDFRIPVGRAGMAVWVSDMHPVMVDIDYISFKNPN